MLRQQIQLCTENLVPPSAVAEINKDIPLSIYPNPAHDFVNIIIKNQDDYLKDLVLTITDINGRMVYNQELLLKAANTKIDINSLKPGVYMLIIKSDEKISKQKLIIHK